MPQPTIGRIVHYQLSEFDAEEISARRAVTGDAGNHVQSGQVYPALVVRTFGGPNANLQVLLDGTDTYWATSRTSGDRPGTWAWPPRT